MEGEVGPRDWQLACVVWRCVDKARFFLLFEKNILRSTYSYSSSPPHAAVACWCRRKKNLTDLGVLQEARHTGDDANMYACMRSARALHTILNYK